MSKNTVKKLFVFLLAVLLCMSLVACDSNNYEKAEELYNTGDFSAALEIYTALGEYEDSHDKATQCKYEIANKYFENAEYKAALELYVELGKYEDVQDKIVFCEKEVGMSENADYAFLNDLESSVLELSNDTDDSTIVSTELECIGKYRDETFYDAELKVIADKYIEGIHIQEDALNKVNKQEYQISWQKGLVLKCEALNELYSKYNFLADNTAFVDTYVDSLQCQQYVLDGYYAIDEDLRNQMNSDDFSWYFDNKNHTIYCILTNNTEYTFGIFTEGGFMDNNGAVFETTTGYIEEIIPGEVYFLEVPMPSTDFGMFGCTTYFDYVK